MIWWIVSIIVLCGIAFAVVSAILDAYMEVNQAPTEPMLWCHKHGFYREKYALDLFPGAHEKALNKKACPFCYKAAVWGNVDKQL